MEIMNASDVQQSIHFTFHVNAFDLSRMFGVILLLFFFNPRYLLVHFLCIFLFFHSQQCRPNLVNNSLPHRPCSAALNPLNDKVIVSFLFVLINVTR